MAGADGGVFSFGATFHGSAGTVALNHPIVGMAARPPGPAASSRTATGYWLVASDGGIFSFGDAAFYGSTGAIRLNKPIVGMAATPSGMGYWLVASDGGIFSFGDAAFHGSTGAIRLNQPITGMAATVSGAGYWLVASDGGVFTFGDAVFHGSAAAAGARDIVSMLVTPQGGGYWQVNRSGQVYAYGDAPPIGTAGRLPGPVVSAAAALVPGPMTAGEVPPGPVVGHGDPDPIPSGPVPLPRPTERPNVLVVVMDDMRADHTLDVMPRTMEWIAEAGATFENGYANTPLCCPERATIFSGRYMHNHGIFRNGEGKKLDQTWTLARYLHDAGYQTGLAGKFLVGWDDHKAPPHYDTYAITNGGYVKPYFNVNGDGRTPAYSTDFLRDISVEFLDGFETDDDKPWYLHVTPQAPHDSTDGNWYWPDRHDAVPIPEWEPSPAVIDTDRDDQVPYVRDQSEAMDDMEKAHDGQLRTLLSADEMVDAIFRNLEVNGELDNTLVIFTSDNGYSWGERGVTSKGLPYVESVKVPFLVRWTGVVPAGTTDPRPVGGVDLLPTLLDAAGYTPSVLGYPLDGRSLLQSDGRDQILLEMHEGHRGIPNWASLRANTWQYIEYYESDAETVAFREYYDLVADPWQLTNLLEDGDPANDPDVDDLTARLAAARTCEGRDGPSGCP